MTATFKGVWFLTEFPHSGRLYTIRFRVGTDGTVNRVELCSPSDPHPPRREMRHAAQRFVAGNAALIAERLRGLSGGMP